MQQFIIKYKPFIIKVEDYPEKSHLSEVITSEMHYPFDVLNNTLWRLRLFRVDEHEHVICLCLHHIIIDGWSAGILHDELTKLYRGYCSGALVSLVDIPINYCDFSIWQRKWLNEERLSMQKKYWQKELSGVQSHLVLPMLSDLDNQSLHDGATYSCRVDKNTKSSIDGFCRSQAVTPFMFMLSVFKVLLYKYTSQSDFVIGSPIANRHYPGVEGLIGFFVNTIPFRKLY